MLEVHNHRIEGNLHGNEWLNLSNDTKIILIKVIFPALFLFKVSRVY